MTRTLAVRIRIRRPFRDVKCRLNARMVREDNYEHTGKSQELIPATPTSSLSLPLTISVALMATSPWPGEMSPTQAKPMMSTVWKGV